MNHFIITDGVLLSPDDYVRDIFDNSFSDVPDGESVFKNIQARTNEDEFATFVLDRFGATYSIAYNFVRMSPQGQQEPNFIHSDEMMGDLTLILYLSKEHPEDDGTTIYNADGSKSCVIHSRYNRMICFDSRLPHSRNIVENFGQGESSRLIQVIFLKQRT